MKCCKRIIVNYIEIAIGLVLTLCGHFDIIDAYWSGMGAALVLTGFLMLFRQLRYKTNSEYQEKVDVEINDKRNKYLRRMAWSWTGYLFVIIAAFASIILKIIGMDMYSMMSGFAVCLLVVLCWLSYMILRRKY